MLGRPLTTAPGSLMTPAHVLRFAGIMVVGGGLYLALGLLFKVDEVVTLGRRVRQQLSRANR